jgi:hypothetical protein
MRRSCIRTRCTSHFSQARHSVAKKAVQTISEVTRRNLFDTLTAEGIRWAGRLEEDAFLTRLYDLTELRSTDYRYSNAAKDIWQHRVRNRDWEDDWVFTDVRFNLLRASDETFLAFLCEMVHPIVRPDPEEVLGLVAMFNERLAVDGWEVAERMAISGRPVYAARRRVVSTHAVESARAVAEAIDANYINRQITRLEAAVEQDADLAIGTAKEFVETICKTILSERRVSHDPALEFPKLVRATLKELKLVPDEVDGQAKAANTTRQVLNNLASISNGIAELRNHLGTGHGKLASTITATPRHARLAVGAAVTLAVFLFETHQESAFA